MKWKKCSPFILYIRLCEWLFVEGGGINLKECLSCLNTHHQSMATTSASCFHLFSFLLFFLFSSNKLGAYGGEKTSGSLQYQHHHVIHTSFLLPAKVCSAPSQGFTRPRGLPITHKNGPCSPLYREKKATPSLRQILLQDQSRVQSIHSIISNRVTVDASAAKLPANSGRPLATGNFIVTIGFGTPKRDLPLVFDTGSDLTWIQCKPCAVKCYSQRDPIFNPSTSTSYSNISCGTPECSRLKSATGNTFRCNSTCIYGIQYGDGSYSVGYFGRETLTLTSSDVFPNFQFGCGQRNNGLFGLTAGLLGLGRDKLSLVSQTSQKYGKKFSYCLPSTIRSTGYLAFGDQAGASSNVKYTPLVTDSSKASFYFLNLIGISVGGQKLSIPQTVFTSSGTIIDSGTVITRLPPTAYAALRSAFNQSMSKYPSAPAYSLFDTCYDLSGNDTVLIPTIALHFKGGTDLDVDKSGILRGSKASQVCLAFAGNTKASDVTILGNTQQQTMEVVYDVSGGRLGFGVGGCS